MKRKKLLKRLAEAKAADVSYASGWDSWKVLDYSRTLVLAVSECDYALDGFRLIPLSEIESLKPRKPIQAEIERYYALYDHLQTPALDLTDWRTALEGLSKKDPLLSVEWRGEDGYFCWRIGKIERVKKHSLILRAFDVNAVWQEPQKIPFDAIHRVSFGDRYAEGWKLWFERHSDSAMSDDEKIDLAAARIPEQYKPAFHALAKNDIDTGPGTHPSDF